MSNRTDEHKKSMAERYLSGESSSALEKETGTSACLILEWVRKFGGKVRTRKEAGSLMSQAHRAFINDKGDFVKICNTCILEKPVSEFTKHRENSDGYSGECRDCRKRERRIKFPDESSKSAESQRRKRQEDPKRFRGYDMKKRFGLDWVAFEKLFDSQKRKCDACGCTESGEPSGSWHIDHDHSCCSDKKGKTCGKCVRGILCRSCNLTLGNAKEDTNRLRKLADYVEKWALPTAPGAEEGWAVGLASVS